MKFIRKWFLTVVSLCILFTLLPLFSSAKSSKRILLLYAYDPTFFAFNEATEILFQFFPLPEYDIDVEFLDAKRYPDHDFYQSVSERISTRTEKRGKYDLVLSGEDDALQFCIENQQNLFPQTPIIFWGVNDKEYALKQDSNAWICGMVEYTFIEKNLKLVLDLHPSATNVVAITDNTTTGQAEYKYYLNAQSLFSNIEFETINTSDYNFGDFKKVVKAIDDNKIIFILSALEYKDGYHETKDSYTNFAGNDNKLIYSNYRFAPDFGMAGGRYKNNYQIMREACRIGQKIFNEGANISNMKVEKNRYFNNFVVDYPVALKYKIKLDNLPGNVQIINQPPKEIKIEKQTMIVIGILMVSFFILLSTGFFRLKHQHRIEKLLRINAENYISLFKDNHSIMLIINPETGVIIDANDAACSFYGYSSDDFKYLRIKDIDKTPNLDLKQLTKTIKTKNIRIQAKHRTKGEIIKDVEIYSGRVKFDNKLNFYAIVHDISDRIKQENLLIEARRRAEESDYLKSAFLANMSHEIRTPMNSILGFSSLLHDSELDKETHHKYLKLIQNNGELLLELISDIIDLSRIEANQLKINVQECKLNELMGDIYTQFHNQISLNPKKQNILFNLRCGIADPNIIIRTDPFRLKQVLLNLLSNALKFTDKGEISFGYTLREDSVLQFFVKDTGIGIPEHKHQSIFRPFEQVEDSLTRNYGGTGLGLSISKSLVEKLGGHIWVMSKLDKGSRFYFTISTSINELQLG